MGFFNLKMGASSKRSSSERATTPRSRKSGGSKKRRVIPIRVMASTTHKVGCQACPLDAEESNLDHPKMEPTGSDNPVLYILGEAPGENEDKTGEQFVGKSGRVIRDRLPRNLLKHIRWNNTVQCRPPGNRTPTRDEIAYCASRVERDIEETQPLIIAGFGAVPLKWALEEENIYNWRGQLVPIRVGNWECWYAALWHPAYILRMSDKEAGGGAFYETFVRDLQKLIDLSQDPSKLVETWIPSDEDLDRGIEIEESYDLKRIENRLEELFGKAKNISVDIETNGIRPYFSGAKILSIAFGTWDNSYAIPIKHRESKWSEAEVKKLWKIIEKFLRKKGRKAWVHSLKFEEEWLSMPFALGREILFEVDWQDTMAQAYVLTGKNMEALSLASRCKALFGVNSKLLDDLDVSNLDNEPLPKVLTYNARDTKFTDKLRWFQSKLIKNDNLEEPYKLTVDRVPALVIAQQEGMLPDYEFAEKIHADLQNQIQKIESKIQSLKEVKEFVAEKGLPFNSASPAQLTIILRDKIKAKEGWRVVKGERKYSTDEKVLSQVKHPIAKQILEKRGLEKLDGTYVVGLCRKREGKGFESYGKMVWDDGKIHTQYNQLKTSTGRLSSEDPNMQNFPKREHKEVRNCVVPPEGCALVSIDYGQIEARVIAMASECPVLIKALWEKYDIHMEWAKIISKSHPFVMDKYYKEAKDDEVKALKLFRSDVKNQWTFPLFFGSILESVARSLGIDPKDLKPQFNDFWDMFSAVKKWQDKTIKFYNHKGYVETLTGRRRYEPMTVNELINSPIQGTASDIVVKSMEKCAYRAYEKNDWHLAARLNIHDDLTFAFPKDNVDSYLEEVVPIMCQPEFSFIIVPITVEISIGDSWGNQEEVATVESIEYGFPKR